MELINWCITPKTTSAADCSVEQSEDDDQLVQGGLDIPEQSSGLQVMCFTPGDQ